MSTQNTNQKQSSINQNSKKNFRGSYKKIKFQVKLEILERLKSNQETLSEIAKDLNINVETIRSLYKKQGHKNLYQDLEVYIVCKCLLQQELAGKQLEKAEISKFVKQEIDNHKNDQQLCRILNDIYNKRLQSKSRVKKSVIEFNSKNRRIIKKIVSFIILAGQQAAINNTEVEEVPKKILEDYYNNFIISFTAYYPVFLDNYEFSQQPLEQDSSMNWFNQQTETRPFGEIIFE
ncbi:unnamed protein product (macronuclear) [Paramecium tetraurelia]|uniref:HTH psq-type domain-containing protein n=1 Tax=Paramecium tetraurelia TaxID=5888 RepID=A0CDI8_PARTE|nr:uncharacterized protein GSPATT00007066001 [Paramecium tetraurelia]CAK68855.1 unnamed protein product [Paramecium tetraurelia]|eukprot:XP_001436252.1 hypothetical protein (macronuclear) [Paramecium tetraurelia strain d4-2]